MKKEAFQRRVLGTIKRFGMLAEGDSVLVAVSGGADSVALAHVLHSLAGCLKLSLQIVHVNHLTRGEDSESDARFVKDFAAGLGLPFHLVTVDVPRLAEEEKAGLEESGRQARYQAFLETAQRCGAGRIATGHTRDDQAETVLMRLLRGAGTAGLEAVLPLSGEGVIRPLLEMSRKEVEDYCRVARLSFREDSTNLDSVFLRNKIRLHLLPLLEREYNPALREVLAATALLCGEDERFLNEEARRLFGKAVSRSGETLKIEINSLENMPLALSSRVLREAIREIKGDLDGITRRHMQAVISLLKGGSGRRFCLPGGLTAVREYSLLKLSRGFSGDVSAPVSLELAIPGSTSLAPWGLVMEASILDTPPATCQGEPDTAFLDLDAVCTPLIVRRRIDGDRFIPFGMSDFKKVKNYLIDEKVPRDEREKIPLLVDREKILWLVGCRLDERVRVSEKTQKVLFLKIFRKEIPKEMDEDAR